MNVDLYDRATDLSRQNHVTSLRSTAAGWTWACSCGAQGNARSRTEGIANRAASNHVESHWKRYIAQLRGGVIR
jgi:hypothetical protein